MTQAEIVPATEDHAAYIAAHVRAADRDELWAAGRATPLEALTLGMARDPLARTGLADGVPVCLFGCTQVSLLSDTGLPWMVGTDALDRHAMAFLRRCRGEVETMQQRFPHLMNYVDARNIRAIAWLKWLGFEIGKPEPFGFDRLAFHKFERKPANV